MHPARCLAALLLCFGLAAAEDPAVAFARGDYAAVVAQLEPALAGAGTPLPQRILLARAYLRLGRAQPAADTLGVVLAVDGDHPEANRLVGEALFRLGRHADALAALKKAYRTAPDSATAGLMGRCALVLGDIPRAKELLEVAVAEDVRDPELSLALARIHLARGGGALAEQHLLLAAEAGLDTVEVHRLLGEAYRLQRKLIGPVVRRRLGTAPKPGELVEGWIALAPAPGAPGEWLLASRYCALHEGLWLLGREPAAADGHALAAAGWLAAGIPANAGSHLAALATSEPDSPRRLALAAEAAVAAVAAVALDGLIARGTAVGAIDAATAVGWLRRLALALAARGERPAAVAALERADRLDPTAAPVLRALAELHAAEGQRAAARLCYQRLIDLNPDATDVDELRNALAALTVAGSAP